MAGKKSVISKVFLAVYSVLFVIFALTLVLGGQKIGGGIYCIYFACEIAMVVLSKHYKYSFADFYKFGTYVQNLFVILSVSSFIYCLVHETFMIAVLCLEIVGAFFDLFANKKYQQKRLESQLLCIFDCIFEFTIIPCFFFEDPSLITPVFAVVSAIVVLVLKVILTFLKPLKSETVISDVESNYSENELQNLISESVEENNNLE